MKEYKYKPGDIICIWKENYTRLNGIDIQSFGKVISEGKAFNQKYSDSDIFNDIIFRYIDDNKDKQRYHIIKHRCTLLIKAKDTTGHEDWKSLMALAKLKL